MKINYKNFPTKFKVQFYDKKRDSTIEMARMIMAILVTFTHMYAFTSMHGVQDRAMLAKIFRTLGGMCTVVFMMFSGYYYAGKPGKGRWFKILMSWLMLLVLNWVLSAIWITASGYLYVGGDNSHLVTSSFFWSHPMGRHGWLNLLLVGNDTHWYMWQFIIAMVFYPFITLGLKTLSKKSYWHIIIGLLMLDTLFKVLVGLGFIENTLGGFIGNYGGDTSYSPWNGYSWILMIIAFMFAGYFRLHSSRDSKGNWMKVGISWGIVLAIVIGISAFWSFSNVAHLESGYGQTITDGYGTYLSPESSAKLYGGKIAAAYNNYKGAEATLEGFKTPISSTQVSGANITPTLAHNINGTWYYGDLNQIKAAINNFDIAETEYNHYFGNDWNVVHRFNWLGFLEVGNYSPTLALLCSCLIFVGIINLPETKNKYAGMFGSLSFAYYALHMFVVTAVVMMFNDAGTFKWVTDSASGSTAVNHADSLKNGFNHNYIKDHTGGLYVMTNLVVALFSIPFAILGTYIYKVGSNYLQPLYVKVLGKYENQQTELPNKNQI